MRPPKGEDVLERIDGPPESILKAVKLQYSLAESPSFWWQTFRDWHISDLEMEATAIDPCMFYKSNNLVLQEIQVTQVENACGGRNNELLF